MADYFVYVLIGIIPFLVYYAFRKPKPKGKPIPGPDGLPFLGKALEIKMENIHEKLLEYANEYGDIVQVKVGTDTLVSLNNIDFIRKAFTYDPYKQFLKDRSSIYFLRICAVSCAVTTGGSVLNDRPENYYGRTFINGSKSLAFTPRAYAGVHSVARKGFTKAFNVYGEGIKVFEGNIVKEVMILVDKIDNSTEKDLEIIDALHDPLANVLAYLLSGERMTEKDLEAIWDISQSISALLNFHNNAILNTCPYLVHVPGYYKKIYDQCSKAKAHIVHRYFTSMKESHKKDDTRGIVDFFLGQQQLELDLDDEQARVWTDEYIIGNILDFLAAGLSTTLAAMSNTILLLSHHPGCQAKLQTELDRVVAPDRQPELNDRANCPYLEAVVMESLRLLPSLPLFQTHTTRVDLDFEGYHLPANSVVVPNAWHILHDEKVWGDPWTFRPVRFLDENGELLPASHPLRKHWIPFGVGRRQCIAEQFARYRLFLFLSILFRRYKFTPSQEKDGACDPRGDNFTFTVVCRTKPFYCRLERRFPE